MIESHDSVALLNALLYKGLKGFTELCRVELATLTSTYSDLTERDLWKPLPYIAATGTAF